MEKYANLACVVILVQIFACDVKVFSPKYSKTVDFHPEVYPDAAPGAALVWNAAAGCTLVRVAPSRKHANVLVLPNRGEIERAKKPSGTSWAGMYSTRSRLIHLQTDLEFCKQVSLMAHEIGHALGFDHTNSGVMSKLVPQCDWWSIPAVDPITTAALRSRCDEISE